MELGTYMDYDIYDQWTCYNKLQFDGTIILLIASHYQYVTHDSLSTSLVMKNVVEVPRMFYSSIDQLDKMLDLDLETILHEYYPAICYKNNINICLTISCSMIPTWNEISLELSLILKVILWTFNPCPAEYLEVFFKDIFLKQYYSTTNQPISMN